MNYKTTCLDLSIKTKMAAASLLPSKSPMKRLFFPTLSRNTQKIMGNVVQLTLLKIM